MCILAALRSRQIPQLDDAYKLYILRVLPRWLRVMLGSDLPSLDINSCLALAHADTNKFKTSEPPPPRLDRGVRAYQSAKLSLC